jgi:hypothetical protein
MTQTTRLDIAIQALLGFTAEGAHARIFAAFADTDDSELRRYVIGRWSNSHFLAWSPKRLLNYALAWRDGPDVEELLAHLRLRMDDEAWTMDGWEALVPREPWQGAA